MEDFTESEGEDHPGTVKENNSESMYDESENFKVFQGGVRCLICDKIMPTVNLMKSHISSAHKGKSIF